MIRAAALLAAAALAGGCAGGSDRASVRLHLVYTKSVSSRHTIWIGDAAGRHMRRLTRGDNGFVSPDGSKVAFSRASDVRVIGDDGGGDHAVARGRPMGWFPDSRHLLVVRGGGLVSVDVEGGDARLLVPKAELLRGWSISPSGERLVYALAKRTSRRGLCGDDLDLFVVDRDGRSRRRITRDGRSSDPTWGAERIAFARHPVDPKCLTPRAGIWTIRPDGSDARPIVRRAPHRFAWDGYYGLRPYAWVRGRPLMLAGVLTEWGDELALVDTRTGRIRKPDLIRDPRYAAAMYVDYVSRDGRYALGTACGAESPCTIRVFSVLELRARTLFTGRVGDAHWNR